MVSAGPGKAMDKTSPEPAQDKTADLLLAIGVGFLINLIIGAALPQIGPFIAGMVAGVIVKTGPLRGAAAGFLAGTLGELASITLWVVTSIISFPNALLPYAWETALGIITAVSAVMALSGGIIGSVVSLQHWPRIQAFLVSRHISFPFLHHSTPVGVGKEDD